MDPASLFISGVVVALLVALATEKVSLDALGILLILVLVASGTVDIETALHGFGNHAVITIAALYVVGAGLTRTGAVEFVARMVLAMSRGRPGRMILLVGLVAGFVSAFLNNTAVVVVFIPVLIQLGRDAGVPASRLLIPLAYASLLGGMCTLVGTSTNLLVSGAAQDFGLDPIGMFELSPVGLAMAVIGIAFMALTARFFLPARTSAASEAAATSPRVYVTELTIGPQSPLLGRHYAEAFPGTDARLQFVERGHRRLRGPLTDEVIEADDVIVLEGDVEQLTTMQLRLKLKMVGNVDFNPKTLTFFELAITPHAGVVGRRVEDLDLYRNFGCVPVAVLRRDRQVHKRASRIVLEAGDLILVCGQPGALARLEGSTDFFLVTGAHRRIILRRHARRALLITGGVVGLFSLESLTGRGWVPIPVAALVGAVAMVASGCVTARRAYRVIDWPILIFVVGTLALGEAMRQTGVAASWAGAIVHTFQGMGPVAVIGALIGLAILFNALVSHSAVAVLLTPIAIESARALGMDDPRAFILAVAYGGSLAFATPLGHQVNLMVFAPGGYRFSDFLRLGLPLSLVCWAVATLGIAWRFGL